MSYISGRTRTKLRLVTSHILNTCTQRLCDMASDPAETIKYLIIWIIILRAGWIQCYNHFKVSDTVH